MADKRPMDSEVHGYEKWLAGGALTIIGIAFSAASIAIFIDLAAGKNLELYSIPFVAIICGLAVLFLFMAYRVLIPRSGSPAFGIVFRSVFALFLSAVLIAAVVFTPSLEQAGPVAILVPFIVMLARSVIKMWRERA